MAYAVLVERTVPIPRARVFAQFTDFGGIAKLMPEAIESCRVDGQGVGAVRHLTLKGVPGSIVERMECAYDGRVFSYSIINDTGLPFDRYHAVVELADAPGGGTKISYGSNWVAKGAPEQEVRTMVSGLYNGIIDAIAKAG
jgi:hypothetical protein